METINGYIILILFIWWIWNLLFNKNFKIFK